MRCWCRRGSRRARSSRPDRGETLRPAALCSHHPDIAAHREGDLGTVGAPGRIERPGGDGRQQVPLDPDPVRAGIRIALDSAGLDGRGQDPIEQREVGVEVRVALAHDASLTAAPHAAAGALVVRGIQGIDDVHPVDDAAERREALLVEPLVVGQVDEHLRRTGARLRKHRECHHAAPVGAPHRIVGDRAGVPDAVDGRIARQAELGDEPGAHPIDAGVVVEAQPHQVVEAVGTVRRPAPVHLENEVALTGGEPHPVQLGRRHRPGCVAGMEQHLGCGLEGRRSLSDTDQHQR